jgi:hypothetical protein
LHEACKQFTQGRFRNSDTGVLHFEAQTLGGRLNAKSHVTSVGKFDRIADQVKKYLPNPQAVAYVINTHFLWEFDMKTNAFVLRF